VRNRSPDKSLHLVYTTDGWHTTKLASGSYVARAYEGDTEVWTATLDHEQPVLGAGPIEFAAVLDQGGVESWDNGYGLNLSCEYEANRLLQAWVCHHGALFNFSFLPPQP
jgi:hypothetical protein